MATVLPQRFDVTTESWCQPVGRAGGDFVLSYRTRSTLRLIVADVSGHGESVAGPAKAIRRRLSRDLHRPIRAATIRQWNRDLEALDLQRFVCVTYLEIGLHDGVMRIANAGNPALLIRRGDGRVDMFPNTGMVLGLLDDDLWLAPTFVETKLGLHDLVVCFTDGVIEQCGRRQEQFGLKRIVRVVSHAPEPPLRRLRHWLSVFRGRRPFRDDVTVLCVQPAARAA